MKAKISGDSIKTFFIQHGEKIVVALSVGVLIMFGVNALSSKGLLDPTTQAPERMKQQVQEVEEKIKTSSPPSTPPVQPAVAVAMPKIPSPFIAGRPLWLPLSPRTDPNMLPAKDVLVASGYGALAMVGTNPPDGGAAAAPVAPVAPIRRSGPSLDDLNNPYTRPENSGGGSHIKKSAGQLATNPARIGVEPHNGPVEGKHWVVVTAVIPLAEQTAEFNRAFDSASLKDTSTDTPKYVYAWIDRVEVAGPDAKFQFTDAKINPLAETTAVLLTWAKLAPDPLDPDFAVPSYSPKVPPITMPLPPLLPPRGFVKEEIIHPKILNLQNERSTSVKEEKPVVPGDPLADPLADPLGDNPTGGRPSRAESSARGLIEKKQGDLLELRYFDFAVQPGKTYRYRVQLMIDNPNFGKPAKDLDDAAKKLASVRRIETNWSDPSPAITIGKDTHLYGGKAYGMTSVPDQIKARPDNLKIAAKIERAVHYAVVFFDVRRGVEATKEFDEVLGSVANHRVTVDLPDPSTGAIKQIADFAFNTNHMVIDAMGGDPITPPPPRSTNPLIEPGEVLFVDFSDPRSPRLVSKSEIDDHYELEMKKKEAEIAVNTPTMPGEGGPPVNGKAMPRGLDIEGSSKKLK